MIGSIALPVHLVATVLAVAPLMAPEPAPATLSALLDDGYDVRSSLGGKDTMVLLQKGPLLYGCKIPAEMLAEDALANGRIPADQIECTPFR